MSLSQVSSVPNFGKFMLNLFSYGGIGFTPGIVTSASCDSNHGFKPSQITVQYSSGHLQWRGRDPASQSHQVELAHRFTQSRLYSKSRWASKLLNTCHSLNWWATKQSGWVLWNQARKSRRTFLFHHCRQKFLITFKIGPCSACNMFGRMRWSHKVTGTSASSAFVAACVRLASASSWYCWVSIAST